MEGKEKGVYKEYTMTEKEVNLLINRSSAPIGILFHDLRFSFSERVPNTFKVLDSCQKVGNAGKYMLRTAALLRTHKYCIVDGVIFCLE